MMRSRDGDPINWIILIVGTILICLAAWAWLLLRAHADGACGSTDWECNGTTWIPTIDGEELVWGDLTRDECFEVLRDLDLRERVSSLDCVEVPVYRTEG